MLRFLQSELVRNNINNIHLSYRYIYMKDIKTGAALWHFSKVLSESENEVWLSENITYFFLPMKLGIEFIFSTVISENAVLGIDLNTMDMRGATVIPIRQEHHSIPLYSLLKIPIDQIEFTDSAVYNMTAKPYMTEYNLNNVITFLIKLMKRAPKNSHESMLRDILNRKTFHGMSFTEYMKSIGKA